MHQQNEVGLSLGNTDFFTGRSVGANAAMRIMLGRYGEAGQNLCAPPQSPTEKQHMQCSGLLPFTYKKCSRIRNKDSRFLVVILQVSIFYLVLNSLSLL